MGLKVIGAGLGRTGTHSLGQALEKLGFGPCYTIRDVRKQPAHVDMWTAALDGKAADWHQLFHSYHSAVEWPTVSFLPEILSNFQQAKVILTLRDPEEWFASANSTIFNALELSTHNPKPSDKKSTKNRAMELSRRLILDEMFSGQYRDKASAISVYERHVQQVRELVLPNQLLEYQVTQGWDLLCAFLNVSPPQEAFPHTNDKSSFLSSAPDWYKELVNELDIHKHGKMQQ